jgi:hydroxymethylpyrimidine pyrophosphatase-like HAD family hydrolase
MTDSAINVVHCGQHRLPIAVPPYGMMTAYHGRVHPPDRGGAAMSPLVVATDLDGTLLRSDSTLSPRTRGALRAARAAGIRIVLATARPARVVAGIFGEEELLDAVICGNGAARYLLPAGELVLTHPLLPELAAQVIAEARRLVPGACFAVETGQRVLHEDGYHYRPSLDDERHAVTAVAELVAGPLVKVMILIPDGNPAPAWALLRPVLGDLVTCTWSAGTNHPVGYPTILEIGAPGVSKAAALADLCAQWSVEPAHVAAFGDARNDLDMLAWAGTGYAVANAHPEVLAATPHRVPSNDEDGVALFLESCLTATPR